MDNIVAILNQIKTAPSESFESEILEFKEYRDLNSLHNSKELSDEIVAFANTFGGTILVGVRDSSNVKNNEWGTQIQGFAMCDTIEIEERIKGRITPRINIKVNNIAYEGKNFLSIKVPRHNQSLVATTNGKIYVRDGRSSRPMTPLEIEDTVRSLPSYDWSEDVVDTPPRDGLDSGSVSSAKSFYLSHKKINEMEDGAFLEAIGATKNGQLTKGGILFLGKTSTIKSELGTYEFRFSWKTKDGNLTENDIWEGCLWESINRAKDHFRKCNRFIEFTWKDVSHKIPLLDEMAFHEAFLNAVTHRDYSKDGMISIDYENQKLRITSPGGFYGGVTSGNIFKHQPRHRNKSLARILMLFQLVDRAGMGIRRISLRSLQYGRAFPTFKEANNCVEVSMEAKYLRGGIFIVTENLKRDCGLSELIILNSIYEVDRVRIEDIEEKFHIISDTPWDEIKSAMDVIKKYAEMQADRDGVYIKARKVYHEVFNVEKNTKTSRVSEKLIKLYDYLKRHGVASNMNISQLLSYQHSSQTSDFLTKTKFVKRTGSGAAAQWSLK